MKQKRTNGMRAPAGIQTRKSPPAGFRRAAHGLTVLGLAAGLLVAASSGRAAAPSPVAAAAKGSVTNRFPVRPLPRTNAVPAVRPAAPGTNAPVAKAPGTNVATARGAASTNAPSSLAAKLRQFQSGPYFTYAIAGFALCLVAFLLGLRVLKSRKPGAAPAKQEVVPARPVRAVSVRKANVHSCNVLEIGPQARQVWHFDVRSRGCVLSRDNTVMEGESLPAMVRKDWRSLFQRKLNVAWLPPEHVFLRAAQFPRSDFSETLAMVELQLEKFSPMPVAQIVWSIHVLPHAEGNQQTVVVMIVSRSLVEEFLGKLEGQGYLADRLELPLLDQLQTTAITEDGAWIYPEVGGSKNMALVAWWYGGVLQNLDLLSLPQEDYAGSLKEQLMQMAWAGEMEGWLSSAPDWHLVADAMTAAQWEPILRQGLEQPIEIVTPLAPRDLAALTARRAATADPRANLLPAEYATRYQQQFVDRLWMRGLLAVAGLYAVGVAIYMAVLGVANFQTGKVEHQVAQLGPVFTNALQVKARFQVLKDRQELKYAALDCWNATARNLPENAELDSINFSQGKRLSLNGTAPPDGYSQMNDFASSMQKTTSNGQPLFEPIRGLDVWRVTGQKATWSLAVELKRSEVQ